ncbi:MAG: ABC transporter permease [Planctomycetota bacterium]|nr:ABC transporter permease [Planctomycetota bacterium]
MIQNPIIRKELLMGLRTRKAVAMQGLFLLVALGLIWLLWPAGGLQDIAGQQGRRILSVLSIGQLLLVVLFAPAFTAAALTSEKEHNTLESLFATSMRPWEIALGKMVGSLGLLMLLVLSGTAALAMPFLLGGVRGLDVLGALGLLLLTAVYLGMIGLLVGTFMHRSYRAIIVTYAVLVFLCFAVAVPAWPISRNLLARGGAAWQSTFHVIASLSPLEAMLSLLWPKSTYTVGAQGMPPFWQLYIPMSLGVITIAAAVVLYKLHRPVAPPRPREKLKVVERGQISARTFLFLIDPRKRKRMIRWWQNPILIKEFRTRPMLQAQWLMRSVGTCLIVSVLLMFLVSLSIQALVAESGSMISLMAVAVAVLMVALILVIGPAAASGTICSDLESGVWELIRVTRLPSWRIVSGKFQASVIPALLLAAATAPALFILLYFDLKLLPNVVRILYVVGMTILFVSTAGMFFSSLFKQTSTATAWTYGLVASLGLATLLVLLDKDMFSRRFIRAIFVLNPIAAAMDAAGNSAMQKLALLAAHLKIMAVTTVVMFLVTVARVVRLRAAD